MQVKIIKDPAQWNDFISRSVCCNITQSYEWGSLQFDDPRVLSIHFGVLDEQDQLCAAMLVSVTPLPRGQGVYFYAPRGPVIDDPSSPAFTVLLDGVHAEARKCKALFLKVEPSVEANNSQWLNALSRYGFIRNPYHMHIRHEWVLDVSADEQTLLANMKEKWRYNIRLATRKGVTLREGHTSEDIAAFYELYKVTSIRDHFPILSQAHYQKVFDLFSQNDHVRLLFAEHEGKVLAATMTCCLGSWSWYMYGASANEGRNLMPNYLLQWTAIQWAKQHGCTYYNFRGIPEILQEGQELWGVYIFKQGFGGFPLLFLDTYDYVYHPLRYSFYRIALDLKRGLSARAATKSRFSTSTQ